jgi:hypothetical protein
VVRDEDLQGFLEAKFKYVWPVWEHPRVLLAGTEANVPRCSSVERRIGLRE